MDAAGDESPRSAMTGAALTATASLGGDGGGDAALAACFVQTAAEPATTGYPWMPAILRYFWEWE